MSGFFISYDGYFSKINLSPFNDHFTSLNFFINENLKVKPQAHSDYIFNRVDDYGLDLDVVFEAKAKEQAILKYREMYGDENCQLAAK